MTSIARFASSCTLLLLAGCAESACELCGTWRSDEPRTLAEMSANPDLSDEQRAFFSDGHFGRLIVEICPDTARAYFDDEDASQLPWGKWETVAVSGATHTIRYQVEGEWEQRDYVLEGECYHTFVERAGFSEWFCRTSPECPQR